MEIVSDSIHQVWRLSSGRFIREKEETAPGGSDPKQIGRKDSDWTNRSAIKAYSTLNTRVEKGGDRLSGNTAGGPERLTLIERLVMFLRLPNARGCLLVTFVLGFLLPVLAGYLDTRDPVEAMKSAFGVPLQLRGVVPVLLNYSRLDLNYLQGASRDLPAEAPPPFFGLSRSPVGSIRGALGRFLV